MTMSCDVSKAAKAAVAGAALLAPNCCNAQATVALAVVGSAAAFSAPGALPLRQGASSMTMSCDVSKAAKAAVAGAALLAAAPAFAGDADAGEKVFNANCAACHAGGQNSVVPDHTLEKSAIEKFLTGGFNEKAVVTQVTNGKGAMPAFGGRLGDDDIANVATYVIGKSEEGWE
eukprot:CAMPEP_0184326538 /NCGR_PEP_ID=MMETSP1049-20130417/142618_1 /TAXON_ID=77928 /ORGANISM="Proteomonas sulcata, Strain CCMP704" /LENGTH=173 /DNA_ID=CAMNT_0026648741 /DNA_START=377 /DNA_END=899 /DNA_ORIENTATION=-